MKHVRLVLIAALSAAAAAAAQTPPRPPSPPASAAPAPAAMASKPRPAPAHPAALGRLEQLLVRHLQARGSWEPLPWREALVSPDPGKLVWHARPVVWRYGKMIYRPAYDPEHDWYYVLRMEKDGPGEYHGPLTLKPNGEFEEWRVAARPEGAAR